MTRTYDLINGYRLSVREGRGLVRVSFGNDWWFVSRNAAASLIRCFRPAPFDWRANPFA